MKRYLQILSATFLIVASAAAQDSSRVSQLNEVVVTGQLAPQSVKNSVYQVRVINRERIRQTAAVNVQQVLRVQPGIRFSNDNTLGISNISLNGMTGRNVKILIDGMPAPDRSDERVVLSQIDVNTIERIEIIEGPMSTVYGSDAMAGVINIITKKISANRKWDFTARAQEESAADEYYPFSYNGVHNQSFSAGTTAGNFKVQFGGARNDFSGFGGDEYGRVKSWLPKEQWLGHALLGFQRKSLNVYYRIDGLREDITDRGKITIDPDPISLSALAVDKRYRSFRYTHQLQGSYRLNAKWDFNGAVSYTNYSRATRTLDRDFITQTSSKSIAPGTQDKSDLDQLNIRATSQFRLNDHWQFQGGFDINDERATGQRILGTPSITDFGLFASAEWKPIKALSIRPGLRFSNNSVYDAPPAIPSVNVKYALTQKTDIRAAYGMGFRAPVLRELYFEFVDANHRIFGNPDLRAERSNSFSASATHRFVEKQFLSFNTTLSAFYNDFRNQIQIAVDKADSTSYRYFNIDRTRTAGFTIDNQLGYKNLRATIGGNFIALARNVEAGFTKLDNRRYLWTPELTSSLNYRFPKLNLDLAVFYKFTGVKPQFVQSGPEIIVAETEAYHLADFNVSKSLFKYFTINAGVRNIFDVNNVNNTAPVGGAHTTVGSLAVDYGRSYFLGLNFQLSK